MFFFADYAAQEFRVALDYAGESGLIEAINAGMDPHQATAEMVGISRKQAKTLNFASIYGAGPDLIAEFLHISALEARELRDKYFARMPKLKHFLSYSGTVAKHRGVVWNRYGRLYYLENHDDSYKIANNLVQGTCADIMKFAMTEIAQILEGKKSRMLIQVHDELIIEMHKEELYLQEEVIRIMQDQYKPKNGMFLTCSSEHSTCSWGSRDKVKGFYG